MSARVRTFVKGSVLLAAAIAVFASAPSALAAAPVWDLDSYHGPTVFEPSGVGVYSFVVTNAGDAAANGPVSLEVELPAGVETREQLVFSEPTTWFGGFGGSAPVGWDCSGSQPAESSISCTSIIDPLAPGALGLGMLRVFVSIAPDAVGPLTAEASVSGGGAAAVRVEETAPVGAPDTGFGIEPGTFKADAFDRQSEPLRQAGAHPFRAFSSFGLKTTTRLVTNPENTSEIIPSVVDNGTPRNVEVRLPRGFVGNPEAATECSAAGLNNSSCSPTSQVGTIQISTRPSYGGYAYPNQAWVRPVYRMVAPTGSLARLGFNVDGRAVLVDAALDPRDYSVVARAHNINETLALFFQRLTLWGSPSDPAHDAERWNPITGSFGAPFPGDAKPFLSLPTQCGVAETTDLARLTSWQDPRVDVSGGIASGPVVHSGCVLLEFDPTVSVKPTTGVADAPTGLEFEMHIPQNEAVNQLATAHLRDAVVTLPAGMTVNPPSADGLAACSMAQVGISAAGVPDGNPVACPDASRLGSVEAESPAVDHPLRGSVFLAEQDANPFGSLLAMYLVVEDPETGVLIKLPGRVDPDQGTGQLTATFKNNPQLPVEDLRLRFFDGPRAALKTPVACGTYTTRTTLTPWSSPEGEDATPQSSFALAAGPGGGACVDDRGGAPNTPAFTAGTVNPLARAYTPFVFRLSRADGTQQLKAIDTTLPEGLLGKLAGIPYCADSALAAAAARSGRSEQGVSSCPLASRVGSVNVGAGAGPQPLQVSGSAYLAGPYKGAPLSLAIITPAVAGPFDLGTVVVRTALYVDPSTAQIHAVSDPLPTILEGIPLNIRSIALRMDRPDFILNPTSCNPMAILAGATSVFGQLASMSERFQVAGCERLSFKPKLALSLKGKTKRSGHPALRAVLTQPGGQANIDRVSVVLPRAQFIDQSRIGEVCTRGQFAGGQCPPSSVLGKATAYSPLLDNPLSGKVFLRSNGGERELPDMVAALRGQIDVNLVGYIDAVVKPGTEISRIRNTFAIVPDAPVSRFVLQLNPGKRALLENSANLCRSPQRAMVKMDGQNGRVHDFRPLVQNSCGAKKRPVKR